MKKILPNIVIAIVFLLGIGVLLYPTISNYVNSFYQGKAIAAYDTAIDSLSEEETFRMLNEAQRYNQKIAEWPNMNWSLSNEEMKEYMSVLNPGETNILGHLEIEKLGIDLPVYHTVNESVLQIGVGHIPGSSLPVGGENSHCILSGHRGLPTSKLFTELDKMAEGDIFSLYVLGKCFSYEVDQIRVVLPNEVGELTIVEGKDLCTLVTCTPYGINTHRLLVRGHRVDAAEKFYVASDAVQMDRLLVSSVIATPIISILLIVALIRMYNAKQRAKLGNLSIEEIKKALRGETYVT